MIDLKIKKTLDLLVVISTPATGQACDESCQDCCYEYRVVDFSASPLILPLAVFVGD
jgi:hypothetical protein